jgi:hypothetical protein
MCDTRIANAGPGNEATRLYFDALKKSAMGTRR